MKNKTLYIFLASWLVFFMFQAWWTPPHIDEVYYWKYSKALDWGYFDHPPMVALMIFLSDLIFSGNLAIRFFSVLTTVLSIGIIYKIVDDNEHKELYWKLIFMLPLLHIFGFITTPDVPLLLFGSLFFLIYRKVCDRGEWKAYLLWGAIMGLMLYAKYHVALLIIFTLMSSPKLFLKLKTYVAGALGLLIWMPHIFWQYSNDWMTFRFHLAERVGTYQWFYPLEYIGNLIALFSPFLIVMLIKVLKGKWKNDFERALYFTLVGFLVFFGYQSFRDHVQPQWLLLTYIPFILLTLNREEPINKKQFNILFWCSVPLFIAVHILMSFDLLNHDLGIFDNRAFADKIHSEAEGHSVLFFDSYRDPSVYEWYYQEEHAHSLNRSWKRKNQYNLWFDDTLMQNEPVYIFRNDYFNLPKFGKYQSYDKLKAKIIAQDQIQIENPYTKMVFFDSKEHYMEVVYFLKNKLVKSQRLDALPPFSIAPLSVDKIPFTFKFDKGLNADQIGLAIGWKNYPSASVYYRKKIETGFK